MSELEEADLLLVASEEQEERNISRQLRGPRLRLHSLLSARVLTVFMLPLLIITLIILFLQLQILQSDQAFTLQPGSAGGVSWVRNMHGEYSLVSGDGLGYNFSQAAAVCQSLHSHLPFIDNKDEERELVKLLGDVERFAWVGLVSKFRPGSWQLYETEEAARYFNFNSALTLDEGGQCAVMGGRGEGWAVASCHRRQEVVLCERLPLSHLESGLINRRVMMGKSECDDATSNIQRDLLQREAASRCESGELFLKSGRETSIQHCDQIHEKYVPNHVCMDQPVNYTGFGRIPTHGPHRPNWASFGQYSYLPMERWQHNLEHGCVVLLYHPCLSTTVRDQVVSLVSNCLKKYVSSPSLLVSTAQPVILVAWGCYREFSRLDRDAMRDFIRKHGLGGPEGNFTKDGLYTHLQVKKAHVLDDFYLC